MCFGSEIWSTFGEIGFDSHFFLLLTLDGGGENEGRGVLSFTYYIVRLNVWVLP